jgi:hypothetical protein
LAKQPGDRFRNVGDLLHALNAPGALGESLLVPRATFDRPRPSAASSPPQPSNGSPHAHRRTESPHGMPWQADAGVDGGGGVIAAFVHMVFRVFEIAIFALLVPVRVISLVFGQGLVAVVRLPFQVLGLTFKLTGYVVVAILLLLVLVGLIALISNFA